MDITVNGTNHSIDAPLTLTNLLIKLGLNEGRIAVEINGEIVPRSTFDDHEIQHQDQIEIVQAIGGG